MSPFLSETKLPRAPKLSCELKFELSCELRCEFLFVSLLAWAQCNTVESSVVEFFALKPQRATVAEDG